MQEVGHVGDEDVIRSFFRSQVSNYELEQVPED